MGAETESRTAGDPSRSALGGADDEKGGAYRAGVGAVIAAYALSGWHLPGLDLSRELSVPQDLRVETDEPVDDLGAGLRGGGRLFVQAKRSLTLSTRPGGPLAKALAQCRKAVEQGGIDPAEDRLVIATGAPSKTIRTLGDALERRRDRLAGAPTRGEAEALAKIEPLLAGLSKENHDLLLDCLVIWHCDAETEKGADTRIGALMLDGRVVIEGDGERGFEALRACVRRLAGSRGGRDRSALLEELREAEVTVRPGGRLLARLAAAGAYRQRLERAGETIGLVGAGADLPPIERSGLDAGVRASEAGAEEPSGGYDLGVLIRRRGRVLLSGLPGSGKSTAMRSAAAEQAAEPEAPLPVFVDLRMLAPRLAGEAPLDAIVATVCAEAQMAEREALGEALGEALDQGEATLFLDALDETRALKRRVVRALGVLLEERSGSLEAIIATRDSGLEAAHVLGFGEARLQPPSEIKETVREILRAYARRDGHEEAWVRRRTRWVEQVLARDPELRQTPLMPILLALSAARRSQAEELPRQRAAILRGVIRDVVAGWEADRNPSAMPGLGTLSGERAAEALFGCFVCEGGLLADQSLAQEDVVLDALQSYLREGWGMRGPEAVAAANEATSFWDEAGFFLRTGDGRLETRVRLFAELADAIVHVDEDDAGLEAWIRESAADPERVEPLKLAAGLSPKATDILAKVAIESRQIDLLRALVEALLEGAQIEGTRMTKLCECLRGLIGAELAVAEDAAGLLGDLDVPEDLRAEMLSTFDSHLGPEQALIAQVRARSRWHMGEDPETRALFLEILATRPPRSRSEIETKDGGTFEFWGVDPRWGEAVVAATRALVGDSEEAAALAAPLIGEVGGGDSQLIAEALEDAGHHDLAARELKKVAGSMRGMKRWQEEFRRAHEAEVALLELIAEVGFPRELSLRERRGLGELVDFIYTLGIPGSRMGESDALTLTAPEGMSLFVRCVAALAELDLPALAAEAALARLEIGDHEVSATSSLLMIPGEARAFTGWGSVADPALVRDQLVRLLRSARFSASVAARALVVAPAELSIAATVDAALPQMEGWQRRLAGLVILDTLPVGAESVAVGVWLASTDSFLARAAALWAAARASEGGGAGGERLGSALTHPDSHVRGEALRGLRRGSIGPELLGSIERAASDPSGWTCDRCGERNPGDVSTCPECHLVGPELRREVDRLLAR